MNKLFVWFIRRLGPLWRQLGADPEPLALIVGAKLKMNDRGGYIMGQRQAPKSGMEFLIFFFMVLIGCASNLFFFFMDRPADAAGLIFCFWIVYIGLLLVTEMSENLFDTRDLYLLLSRPISDATFSLARLLHIGMFTLKFALCLGVPVVLFCVFYFNPVTALGFIIAAALTVLLTMTLTLLLYLLLIRLAPRDKLRSWIGYLQVAMTVIFFGLYQLPNLYNFSGIGRDAEFDLPFIVGHGWGFVFPGLWAGGVFDLFRGAAAGPLVGWQAGLCLLVAGGGLWLYVRQSRGYGQNLLDMQLAGSGTTTTTKNEIVQKPGHFERWRRWLGQKFTRPGLQRASYNFHWAMTGRDIDYKQRTYPTVVMYALFIFFYVYQSMIKGTDILTNEVAKPDPRPDILDLGLVYALALVVVAPLTNTKISKAYQASWIFLSTPGGNNPALRYGQLLAVLVRFALPLVVIAYGLFLFSDGLYALDDLVMVSAVLLGAGLALVADDDTPPFGQSIDKNLGSNIGSILAVLFITPLVGVAHYFASVYWWGVPLLAVLFWLVVGWQFRKLKEQ